MKVIGCDAHGDHPAAGCKDCEPVNGACVEALTKHGFAVPPTKMSRSQAQYALRYAAADYTSGAALSESRVVEVALERAARWFSFHEHVGKRKK